MTVSSKDDAAHKINLVNGIEIPPLDLYPPTHLSIPSPSENQTLTHSPSEPWILAPIMVQFQKTTMKKAPAKTTESRRSFLLQTFVPFIFAGLGLIVAGHILEGAEKESFFTKLPDIVTLVPTLLGLKGNLEMTLGSRLSTLAHLGEMDTFSKVRSVALSNLALVQTQAIVVSSIAVVPAVLLGEGKKTFNDLAALLFSSVLTASLTSFILGNLMVLVVIVSRKTKLNPDNIVTPVAASLGDVATLLILINAGSLILENARNYGAILPVVGLVILYATAIICGFVARKNRYTFEVLKHGWYPILAAMAITLVSGFLLKMGMHRFPPIAAFQPLVNGVGGNLVAVQASRIGTRLHQARKNKEEDHNSLWIYASPWRAFFNTNEDSIIARLLLFMSLPGNIVFLFLVFLLGCGFDNSPLFSVSFLIVSFIQVITLLYICQFLVRILWRRRVDPDNAAIPLLTALGDLFGTSLLLLNFLILSNVFGRLEVMTTSGTK